MIKNVTEFCPGCEREVILNWDIEQDGFRAFCPYCGERLMLCDECQHRDGEPDCDYDSKTDSCRYNRKETRAVTNMEKIKNMSREELAKFLMQIDLGPTPYCGRECAERCEGCAIEWLGEEAKR